MRENRFKLFGHMYRRSVDAIVKDLKGLIWLE